MEDFASGDGGSDLISLVAYLRDCSQGEAARELAEKLGVALYKGKGASSPKANGYASHVAPEVKAGCCGLSPREGRAWLAHRQLLQQCIRFLQIARVEPFGEPAVNWSQQVARLP